MFEAELQYFIDNQGEFVQRYAGKVLLIVGNQLIGAFSSALAAYEAGLAQFGEGTFLIQPCRSGREAYTIEINGGL